MAFTEKEKSSKKKLAKRKESEQILFRFSNLIFSLVFLYNFPLSFPLRHSIPQLDSLLTQRNNNSIYVYRINEKEGIFFGIQEQYIFMYSLYISITYTLE